MVKTNILKDSFLYIVSDAVFGGLPILLLPILSHYLLPAEYGLYTNVLILMNLFSVFINFSSSAYYSVNFHSTERIISREQLFSNLLSQMIINTLIIGLIISFFLNKISELSLIPPKHIYVALFIGLCISINSLFLTKLRFYNKVFTFVSLRILQAILHSALAICLVIYFEFSWIGRYVAHFLSIFLILPIIMYKERRVFLNLRPFLSLEYLVPSLLFGLTLLPHTLSSWIKTGLDRLLLTNSVDVNANGIYSTGFQLSIVISLIGVGFNKAFSPVLFKKINEKEYKSARKVIFQFLMVNLILVVLTILVVPIIIKYFLSEKYFDVLPIVPYIITAQGFLNIYIILSNILFYVKKTVTLSVISFFSAFIHVFFLYLLIEEYLVLGAAISFLISALIQTLLTSLFVYKKARFLWK